MSNVDPNAETYQQLAAVNSGADVPESEPAPDTETPKQAQTEPVQENVQDAPHDEQGSTETLSDPIVVDGKQFKTEREAFEYTKSKLSESETEKLITSARLEGMEAALMNQGHAQVAPPQEAQTEPEDDSDEFYSDPSGYMKKKEAQLEEKIEQRLQSKMEQKQADEKLWSEFFQAHPDLEGFRSDCEMVLNQPENLKTIQVLSSKDRKRAMDYLATKTREKFQMWAERQKPRKTLERTNSGPSEGSPGGVTPTAQNQEEKVLDLTSQMRSMRYS